ncbi:MAG: rhodanese-like domain-containing protein [Deltaproteobacteria bacterium]|nr:rhodanese-like domain-containing protein [Deltaproteobacteria bacterium]
MACGAKTPSSNNTSARASFGYLSPEELKATIDRGEIFNLVDVRSVQEYIAGHLPGAISIPYGQLPYRYRQLMDPRTLTVIYCQTGLNSILAAQMLAGLGFSDLYNLSGGFNGWEYAVELSNRRQVI